eukprot:14124901-Alexandrium_andersonii.AAC.1
MPCCQETQAGQVGLDNSGEVAARATYPSPRCSVARPATLRSGLEEPSPGRLLAGAEPSARPPWGL